MQQSFEPTPTAGFTQAGHNMGKFVEFNGTFKVLKNIDFLQAATLLIGRCTLYCKAVCEAFLVQSDGSQIHHFTP